jgi:AraC-like DNA-binding protein
MIGSVNEVLNNQHSIAEAGLLRLRLALWEFVSAIRDVLAPRSDAPPPRARKLYDEATRRIGYARSDQPMSVRQLCASLHVSERHLRTVFSVHGDSPSGLIRRIRVYRTAVVLRGDAPVSTRGIDELARSLGYSGRRQMRRELRNLVASTHELDQPVRIVLLSLPSETRTLIGV